MNRLRFVLVLALTSLVVAVIACGPSVDPNVPGKTCGSGSKAKVPHDNSCDRFRVLPCSIDASTKTIDDAVCKKECPITENGTKALGCGVDRDANGEPYLGCSYCITLLEPR